MSFFVLFASTHACLLHPQGKGLVRQQLDSFNRFITENMQDTIDSQPPIEITPIAQFTPGIDYRNEVRHIVLVCHDIGALYHQFPTDISI